MPGALRVLLTHAVDYAGLFPPAKLDMRPAVEGYADYRAGPDAWALGRFVVPAVRLDEFERAAAGLLPGEGAEPWRLSAIAGPDVAADAERIAHFNSRHGGAGHGALVDALELKADTPAAVRDAATLALAEVTVFAELPLADGLPALVAAVRECGLCAKVRTGGVTADAFPGAAAVARFIAECSAAGVAFKATAGLHHSLRGRYPLTYERGSPSGVMFGYLNVLLATALARAGVGADDLADVLDAPSLHDARFSDQGLAWHGRHVSIADLLRLRETGMIAFGSCSFTEPMQELAALPLS